MQMKKSHRLLAVLLALVMVVGLLPTTVFARSAGDDGSAEMNEGYAAHASLMPVGPSFNVNTLLEWTPESDPDAIYSRASIPLANREGGFVVNPKANPQAKLMLCSLANADHDTTSAQGTESFLSYAFNYWQYTDSFVYWSGSEEGIICCPTGEFTDAAHTNGVPVVATLGFPWGSGAGYVDQVKAFVQKNEDGTFPVADKLIAVMDYYGFDGYFFNQESYGCSAAEGQLIDEMMRYMHQQRPDMLISWYDSMLPTGGVSYQNAVTDANKQFMTDSADGTRAIDEFMMNYNWYETQINTTISTMKAIGRSQFDAFAGIDVQQNCMDTSFRDYLLVDADGVTRMSLALYCPNSTMGLSTSPENFHEVEQTFYTNTVGDPRDTSVDLNTNAWAGMSRFYADKTTILGAPFVTDFNSGHGKGYYVDGVLSRDGEWSYQSNQDVMPTWTWIIDSEGDKLTGGYDFTTAWNGGNSIKFSGSLSANKANDILLYSTKIPVESGMKLGLTCKGDQGLMKLVAYYGDSATVSYEACEKVEYALTASEGDWTTTVVDISAAAGKTLYAIGLKVESSEDVADYQVNLGRLTVTEKDRAALTGPASVTLDEILYTDAFTAEARVYWKAVTGASSYEIYKVNGDGSKSLIMETPNTAYYIPTLTRAESETDVTLEVVPVNRNGVRGTGTQLTVDWLYGNEDSEKIEIATFENVCLNAEVTGVSFENSGEPASKALDGTAANNSKWCATNMSSGWMSIDIGREVTVKRWRVEHAEYGGEANNMNTIDFALEYKDAEDNWVQVKRIQNNHDAVTDVLLDAPVTAREWRLYIYDDGSSPWGGIRIYEWQMFETDQFPQTTPVGMQFASAQNNEGAADRFTLENVPNGQTVKVYLKSEEGYTQIGEATSTGGTVTLENLDFGTAEAGRVYYTTTAMAAAESAKLSAPFEAESAEKSAPAQDVSFVKYSRNGSTSSSNGDDIYTTLTVNGLASGDVVYVYEDGVDAGYTKASLPVAEGATSVSLEAVRVVRAGGTLTLQVKRTGKLISDTYTVETPAFEDPTATLTIFAANRSGETLTGVRFGVYNAAGEKVTDISTTSDSGGKATLPLGTYTLKCEEVPEGYGLIRDPIEKRLNIEGWNYELQVEIGPFVEPTITSVTVEPATASVMKGGTAQFTATVTGEGMYEEGVAWSVTGGASQDTAITEEGLLTVADDETAQTLTVVATSTFDPTQSGSATVSVTELVNVSPDATLWGYSGYNGFVENQENGPEKLFDGDFTTKWSVDSANQWVAIDLGQYMDVYAVRLYHAGSAGEDSSLNTESYEVRGLFNYISWYENMAFSNRSRSIGTYITGDWTQLIGVSGNTADVTTDNVEPVRNVRYLLVRVTDDCANLYELEILADAPEILSAAREAEALIGAIAGAEDREAAVTAARTAYDRLTNSGKALVGNYLTLVAAEAEQGLTAYYNALLTENVYSAQGREALAQALADGLAALKDCDTEAGFAAALADAKAAMDAVMTLQEELDAIVAAAQEAQEAAQEAAEAAEAAKAAAEEARKAAEEAAASAAGDKTAAEEAAREAEAAEARAKEAQEAAETARKAAEDAAAAAEASNLAAAEEAKKAAQEAQAAAYSAASAAEHARQAADAQKGAQAAQEAAEAAQKKAEDAQAAAEEAKAAAEEAARTAGEDSAEAKRAREEAEAAQAAAEEAQKAAENAQAAAEAARDAAAAHDAAAAASAAEAAKYALEVATMYEEICAMKLEMAQYLAEAQRAQLACTKYYALFDLATYADKENYAEAQQAELAEVIAAGTKAIQEAETVAAVEEALAEAKAAIDEIKTLADLEAEKPPFTDVAEDKWYYEAVKYVYWNGLFKGTTDTTFTPNGTMDRAMMITVLYRLAGEPEVTGATDFTDVNPKAYYYNALLWATQKGIAKGVTDTAFAPGSPITREQMVTFLYRYAELAGQDVTASAGLEDFAD
ncbi:MAG: discoidin domain-containing protein, partial [Candidatus Faecousia sp.]|nr:discoidin domain-containing protein [Candidatus Faecousia sp.]